MEMLGRLLENRFTLNIEREHALCFVRDAIRVSLSEVDGSLELSICSEMGKNTKSVVAAGELESSLKRLLALSNSDQLNSVFDRLRVSLMPAIPQTESAKESFSLIRFDQKIVIESSLSEGVFCLEAKFEGQGEVVLWRLSLESATNNMNAQEFNLCALIQAIKLSFGDG